MTNPYRAMCAELADALAEWRLGGGPPEDTADADLIARARALLAEPEAQEGACSGCEGTPVASNSPCAVCGRIALTQPVAEEPTDDEIEEWADACSEAPLEEMDPEIHGWRRCFTAKEFSETIRAALARWGRPTPQPVATSERLPGPEDCDELEFCWQWEPDPNGHHPLGHWERVHRDWVSDPDCDATHWLPSSALPLPVDS